MRLVLLLIVMLLNGICSSAQLCPFAIIDDADGYTNVRYGKTKKVTDKLYDNQVFAVRGMVDEDGWQDWQWIDYPDYSLVKLPFEKFINKTKEGMMHKSRIALLSDLPKWQNKHIDSTLWCVNGKDSLSIQYGLFNKQDHSYTQDVNGIIYQIDGREPWGIDGSLYDDLMEIKSITLRQRGNVYEFPKEAIKNLLQPNAHLQNFGVAEGKNGTLFLYMSNSDGAGSYDVVWTIVASKVISQYLYRSF